MADQHAIRAAWDAVDPQIAEHLRAFYGAASVAPATSFSVQQLRESLRQQTATTNPQELHAIEPVVLQTDAGSIPGRLYRPISDAEWVIVYFHGGGWVRGDLDTADGLVRRLAHLTEADVISVGYRLAPEDPFPAGLDDALAALRWGRDLAGARPLAVAGDSAGGNLAAVCALGTAASANRVAAQLLCYPVVDSDLTRPSYSSIPAGFPLGDGVMAFYWDCYLPDHTRRSDPRVAPLRSPELHTAAPAVILLARQDPLYDEGCSYAHALERAGVPVRLLEFPGAVHGFLSFEAAFALRDRALADAVVALRELVFPDGAAALG